MPRIHVERSIQFKTDLYKAPDRTAWFTEVGKELEKRKLSITLAPGVEVKNADQLVALMKRYQNDKAGLQTALNLPAGTTLANYVQDLVQALDDVVKPTSDVTDKMIDMGAAGEYAKLLGLDTNARYASGSTAIGKAKVDAVHAAGGVELSRSVAAPDPLAGRLYMDSKTFAGMPGYSWNRNGVELEQVAGVSGVDGKDLLKALRQTNNAGRTTFQRLRKPEMSEAYTIGYSGVGLDDMRWDGDSHRQREKNKFVSLTVESGRYEAPAPAAGSTTPATPAAREISVGTDKMDDTYYDTADFRLMDADFSVRGRARWDTDTEIRRILVGVKSNTTIDEFGMKRNGKVDVRNDGASAEEIANLDKDIRTGTSSWNGSSSPLTPLKGVYDALNKDGALPDVGGHTDVLELEPKVHMRSVRSRYHLNETSLQAMQDFYGKTSGKLDHAIALATAAQPKVTGADKAAVDALLTAANGIKDASAIVKLAEEGLKKLDPAMTVDAAAVQALMPQVGGQVSWNRPTYDQLTIDKRKVVAEALDKAYHDLSPQLDAARRAICESQDRTYENHPPLVMAWMKSADPALINKKTYDPILAKFEAIAAKPEAERAVDLKAFNDYGNAQKAAGARDFRNFTPLDDKGFLALKPQLLNEVVRVEQRQLEAAGSMALGLWYEDARNFYVPSAGRNTGNFIIDTTDMTEYVKHADWEAIPADKRTPANQLPEDKVFHVSLVNETQIELGEEKAYIDRLGELGGKINEDRASLAMKWFDATSRPGVDATKPETYAAAFKALLDQPADARDADLGKLNAFFKAQGSPLTPVTAKDAAALAAPEFAGFTAANRDKAVRTTPDLERSLDGARFIFQQILDVQKAVVASKESRVTNALENAGLRNFEWKQTDSSKGLTALKMVRDGVR
jgi:hypothetical protein